MSKKCFNCGQEIEETEPDSRPFIYHSCPDGSIACIKKDRPVKKYNYPMNNVKDKRPDYFGYYF